MISKNEIIDCISENTEIARPTCEMVVDSFIEETKKFLLRGEKIMIKGFLTLEVIKRKPRNGRNPHTGEVDTFPSVKVIKCKISKLIKDMINEVV